MGALLVGFGVAMGAFVGSRSRSRDLPAIRPLADSSASASDREPIGFRAEKAGGDRLQPLERRLDLLAAKVAADAAERHRLEQRLDQLAAQLAALHGASSGNRTVPSSEPNAMSASPPTGDMPPSQGAALAQPDDATTAVERALVAAGVDPATAADIKRRRDQLTLDEIYLRDQATREQWMDSPRFAEEMAEIARQRTSIRDEIGDDAYDRYLAAMGQANRVRVEEVLLDSPAAQAGLQTGDLVLSYGNARIFAPDDLVSETRSGTPGESTRIEIVRNGQLLDVNVPRGPLGVNIVASRASPEG